METRFQTTSFIPKTSLDNIVSENGTLQKKPSSTTGNLMLLLCFFLFVCSLVSAGVVFFLGRLTASTEAQVKATLDGFQKRNTAETLVELKNLNDRLFLVTKLIQNHVAISPLFDKLAQNTLSRVSFNNFDLKRKADGSFALSLKAQGIGYESIVAQDTQFSSALAQKTFKNTVINDFSKAKNQDIAVFNLTTTIPASEARFIKYVSSGSIGTTTKNTSNPQ
jgi:hypothetical protein